MMFFSVPSLSPSNLTVNQRGKDGLEWRWKVKVTEKVTDEIVEGRVCRLILSRQFFLV